MPGKFSLRGGGAKQGRFGFSAGSGKAKGSKAKSSKTGNPVCSAAMSAWKSKGGGMTASIAATLGKCRAQAAGRSAPAKPYGLKAGAHQTQGTLFGGTAKPITRATGRGTAERSDRAAQLRAARAPAPAPKAAAHQAEAAGFALAKQSATGHKSTGHKSTAFHNEGSGKTHFMFDMKKGDLRGQTSIFDRPAKPSARDQAAAHRAKKGTVGERAEKILARLDARLPAHSGKAHPAAPWKARTMALHAAPNHTSDIVGHDTARGRYVFTHQHGGMVLRSATTKDATAAKKWAGAVARKQRIRGIVSRPDIAHPLPPDRPSLRDQAAAARKGSAAERSEAARKLRKLHKDHVDYKHVDAMLATYGRDPFKGRVRISKEIPQLSAARSALEKVRKRTRKAFRAKPAK